MSKIDVTFLTLFFIYKKMVTASHARANKTSGFVFNIDWFTACSKYSVARKKCICKNNHLEENYNIRVRVFFWIGVVCIVRKTHPFLVSTIILSRFLIIFVIKNP